MVAQITTFAFHGVDARPVTVQVQLTNGSNPFTIVGLPDKSVSEARERVRAALSAVGLGLPAKRITVNLAPADLPKEGSHFDLAIALGLLQEMGAAPHGAAEGFAVMGELGLDGSIAPVAGALPAAVAANAMGLGLICPAASGAEAAWAGGEATILAPSSLIQLVNHFKGAQVLSPAAPGALDMSPIAPDLADVKGQENAKRAPRNRSRRRAQSLNGGTARGRQIHAGVSPARTIAALDAGGNARNLHGSIPGRIVGRRKINESQALSRPASFGVHGRDDWRRRPRQTRGGVPCPSRSSFFDELPEFSAPVLDSLRQPLETGDVLIARANFHVRYPARFQLVAAMNPCRCGYGRASGRACGRGPNCEEIYQSRISGPLLDRMDLSVELAAVPPAALSSLSTGEPTKDVAARVAAARDCQVHRAQTSNAALSDSILTKIAEPDAEGAALLSRAAETLGFSARAYMRILRVARTLADLDGVDGVRRRHIAEAVSFRRRETMRSADLGRVASGAA